MLDPRNEICYASCHRAVMRTNGGTEGRGSCARKGGGLTESADWAARCAGRRRARRLVALAPARRLTCGGLCARVWGERKRWRRQLGSTRRRLQGRSSYSQACKTLSPRPRRGCSLAGGRASAGFGAGGWLAFAGWLASSDGTGTPLLELRSCLSSQYSTVPAHRASPRYYEPPLFLPLLP